MAIRAAWARADDTQLASLTTALGGPDNPITRAEYDINVHWEGRPRVAVTTVHLDRIDGSSAHLDLVFSLAGDTPAALQLFGEGRPPKEEP